jgi:hypothetical protein
MPAEAVHFSALSDTRDQADAAIGRLLAVHAREAQLGAILVDLPYFERFPVELARYVARLTPRPSRWGDVLHRAQPARVGLELLRAARAARRDAWLALALGYLSHAAVDRAIHPLVNALARPRARALRSSEAAQHREVEKFQSILFHERRFGRDFMGTRYLLRYLDVEAPDRDTARFLDGAVAAAVGEAPLDGSWARWVAGYRQYVRVIASPLGLLPAPPAAKARERAALYDAVGFDAQFADAARRSLDDVTLGFQLVESNELDGARYFGAIPEGSIDDPPVDQPSWAAS